MSVAFFDLDKTLISVNSANLWVKVQWKQGLLGKRQLLRMSSGLLRYSLGLGNLEKQYLEAISYMKGQKYALLEQNAENFYRSHVAHLFRPGALVALKQHREQGDIIVMLTTSPHAIARLAAHDLNIDHCLSTVLEVDANGLCTGNTVGPLCYGQGKVLRASQWLKTQHFSFTDSIFYTDSFTDLPMLEAVGRPVVVNPDIRLQRAARAKQWAIVDWGIPNAQN